MSARASDRRSIGGIAANTTMRSGQDPLGRIREPARSTTGDHSAVSTSEEDQGAPAQNHRIVDALLEAWGDQVLEVR